MSRKIEKLSGLVLVTGGSSGIGLELAKLAAADGCSLILAADTDLSEAEAAVGGAETLQVDLSTEEGVDQLVALIGDRQVDALFANAGHGGGGAFLDQDWSEAKHIVDTDVTGTIRLIQKIGQGMRQRNRGRILITGSIAGHIPGSLQLVYNSTKAFLDDFSVGLRNELKDTDVVVTCRVSPTPTSSPARICSIPRPGRAARPTRLMSPRTATRRCCAMTTRWSAAS